MKYWKLLIVISILAMSSYTNAAVPDTSKKKFEVKVAIVDIQSILENSLAVQSIRKSIEGINQKIQEEILKKEAELKKIEDELIKKRSTLSEEAFEKEVNKFNQKVSEAQKEIQGKKTRLEHAHAEAMGKVHEATINIVSELATKHGLNLVIPSTQILFAKNNLNMTSEVITHLNKKLQYVKINY